jgi:DNA polymerase eta
MSSADPPNASPDAVKHSRYTFRQLHLLRQGSTATPLRAIAHIDLDAFYAQCEMVRLGTDRDTPLAVRQWDSLIAVNYAARPSGITRMVTTAEARKLCPNIILQHVATFREGEGGRWAYRDDSFKNIRTDKVSLDPYRAESRKILKTMKEELEQWSSEAVDEEIQSLTLGLSACLEKAGIDEVFVDMSPLIYRLLLQRYPELRQNSQDDNRDAELPPPPTTAIPWDARDSLIELDKHEREEDDPDWDDVVMQIAAEIVRSVRTAVWNQLHYTCSAGVARNKMLAKLGSACNKPNAQTIVRNRAVQFFLNGYKFTQIRMLGGKLGEQITSDFGTEQVIDLLGIPYEQLRAKLDDHTATWLYGVIRGEDRSEVNPRTQIKSMLSAKSFRPSINSVEQAEKWLHIFAADIYGRLVEDGVLENRRRPRVITLYHRVAQSRSRQIPIPGSSKIDEDLLFELAKKLLGQVVAEGQAWPCSNLSLSVSSFEDGVSKNKAIEGFLVRGDQAKVISQSTRIREIDSTSKEALPAEKKRRVDGGGIKRFFTHSPFPGDSSSALVGNESPQPADQDLTNVPSGDFEPALSQYTCDRCSKVIPEDGREEHDDWHFAKDLELQDRQEAISIQQQSQQQTPPHSARGISTRGRGGRGRGKPERGQKRLFFQ